MAILDRKLRRDLWELKGQVLAIALVIAGGIATFIMIVGALDALRSSRDDFYREYRFGDLFATLKRAPDGLLPRIRAIPGVQRVDARVVGPIRLDMAGFPEPVTGLAISLPDQGEPPLNRLYLSQGRLPEAGRDDEAVISRAFAEAHRLKPGDALQAVINGRRQRLRVVGLGLSPEHIVQMSPGGLAPDPKRYAVLWMARTPLGHAFDLAGAFNDVVLSLAADARPAEVIDRLDGLLRPYGGRGAYGRQDQFSYRALRGEIRALGVIARIFPAIFLGVATFLLNVVVSRLVSTQREQIAALKSFGYGNGAVGLHYLKFALAIVLIGIPAGLAAGAWLAAAMSEIYVEFYHFPDTLRHWPLAELAGALLTTVAAAVAGTLQAVRKAALLPPAQAMRPEPPKRYRRALLERAGLGCLLSQPGRMIVRHIERSPVKSVLTVVGIALACATLVLTSFFGDSFYYVVDAQFKLARRQDLAVDFTEPVSGRALYRLQRVRGVEYVEGTRWVPVRLRAGHRSYRTVLHGIERGGRLRRLLDTRLRAVELPPEGIVLTDYLGRMLGVGPGDRVTVEVLEGARPLRELPVAGLVSEFLGSSGYMDLAALRRLLGEGKVFDGAYLTLDQAHRDEVFRALKGMPRVAGAKAREVEVRNFYQQRGRVTLFTTAVASLLAGVVYNSARIALTERAREMASLRVLGLTRGEIAYILLGELALLTLAALPMGFLFGRALCAYFAYSMWDDQFRMPVVLNPDAYALAAAVILASAVASGLAIRRSLDRLDLVAALKTRE